MYSNANYYYKSVTKSRSSSLSNLSDDFLNEEISKDDPMYDFKEAAKKAMMSAPYNAQSESVIIRFRQVQFRG